MGYNLIILRRIELLILLLITVKFTNSQKPGLGGCPNYVIQSNFFLDMFLGTWYEVEKYPVPFEFAGRCITARYWPDSKGNFRVYNQQIIYGTNQEESIYGYLKQISGAELEVSLPTFPFYSVSKYFVIETDYQSYAVTYSCNDYTLFHLEYIWILTRERHPLPETLASAYAAMDNRSMNRSYLRRTQQNGCEDYANDENN